MTAPGSLQNVQSLSHNLTKAKLYQLSGRNKLKPADKAFLKDKSIPFTMHLNVPNFLDLPHQATARLEFLCINAFHDESTNHVFGDGVPSSITDIPAAKLGKLTGPDHKNSEAVNGNGGWLHVP